MPGDGIGPEVTAQARRVIELVAKKAGGIELFEGVFGGAAVDQVNDPLPQETLKMAVDSDAVLLGAVGDPKHDKLPMEKRPEKGLLRLRSELGVFANLRPVSCLAELSDSSALRQELVKGLDILIVRELTGGIYFGNPRGFESDGDGRSAFNTMRYSASEVRRIAKVALESAMKRNKKLCSVDKANVLEVSMLWRETMEEEARNFPEVELSHMYVDNCAMQLVRNPGQFDVLVTSNLFGDILSDLASELAGSIGMLPSAAIGEGAGLYEPVHGSAPDIAGKDLANPCAAMLSVAMLFEHSFNEASIAKKIRDAVKEAIASGLRTQDIAPQGTTPVGCEKMGDAIVASLERALA